MANMEKKKIEKGIKVFQSNDLLEAQKKAESIDELRLFYIGLRGIIPKLSENQDKYDKEFPEIFLPSSEVVELFGGNGAYYTKLESVCEAQAHRIVSIKTDDGFEKKPIYSQIQYKVGKGLSLTFNPLMKPYLLDLAGNQRGFTEFIFEEIFALRSVYSWKLLEIIRQWIKRTNFLQISLQELRDRLCLAEGQYSRFADFRRYVLDSTIKEINRETIFLLSYDTIRSGRKIVALKLMWRHKDVAEPSVQAVQSGVEITQGTPCSKKSRGNEKLGGIAPLAVWQQELFDELVQKPWKVTVRRANELVREYSENRIRANIDYCANRKIDRNPGGYLWRAIREDYAGFEENYLEKQTPVLKNEIREKNRNLDYMHSQQAAVAIKEADNRIQNRDKQRLEACEKLQMAGFSHTCANMLLSVVESGNRFGVTERRICQQQGFNHEDVYRAIRQHDFGLLEKINPLLRIDTPEKKQETLQKEPTSFAKSEIIAKTQVSMKNNKNSERGHVELEKEDQASRHPNRYNNTYMSVSERIKAYFREQDAQKNIKQSSKRQTQAENPKPVKKEIPKAEITEEIQFQDIAELFAATFEKIQDKNKKLELIEKLIKYSK